MEVNTLQQRIEERAKDRLEKDLLNASEQLFNIGNTIGYDFRPILDISSRYLEFSKKAAITFNNNASKDIFVKLMPKYVSMVTDELLQKVDEIDWLLQNQNKELDY